MTNCVILFSNFDENKAWERADFLALLHVLFCCVFVTIPYGVQDQMWYLVVSSPDLCLLPYFGITCEFSAKNSHEITNVTWFLKAAKHLKMSSAANIDRRFKD